MKAKVVLKFQNEGIEINGTTQRNGTCRDNGNELIVAHC